MGRCYRTPKRRSRDPKCLESHRFVGGWLLQQLPALLLVVLLLLFLPLRLLLRLPPGPVF